MSVEQLQDNMEEHDPEQHDAVATADTAASAEQPGGTDEPMGDAVDPLEAVDVDVEPVDPVAPAERAALLASVPEVVVEGVQPEAPSTTDPSGSTEPPAPDVQEGAAQPSPDEEVTVAFDEPGSDQVSIWPFVVYDVIWLVFAGVMVWQLTELPPGTAVYESGIYPLTLLGGLVLTAAGPVLIVATWLFERRRLSAASGQVFLSALFRGSVATLLGVAIWWAALIALDQLRLGRLF